MHAVCSCCCTASIAAAASCVVHIACMPCASYFHLVRVITCYVLHHAVLFCPQVCRAAGQEGLPPAAPHRRVPHAPGALPNSTVPAGEFTTFYFATVSFITRHTMHCIPSSAAAGWQVYALWPVGVWQPAIQASVDL
jgi:hypothetical protein